MVITGKCFYNWAQRSQKRNLYYEPGSQPSGNINKYLKFESKHQKQREMIPPSIPTSRRERTLHQRDSSLLLELLESFVPYRVYATVL